MPPTQDPLWPERNPDNVAPGAAARDDALQRVADNAEVDWRAQAENALRYVALRRAKFTSDPVWTTLQAWGVPAPHEPRALGPLMKSAVTWGWITPIEGEWSRSVRPDCHRRPLQVYASHLHLSTTAMLDPTPTQDATG